MPLPEPASETPTLVLQGLREGPDRIRNAATAYLLRSREVGKLRRDLKRIELLTSVSVANELVEVDRTPEGPKLKPKFGNADARAAEAARRLDESADVATLRARIEAGEEGLEAARIDLEYWQDDFKALIAQARILGARA